MADIRNFAAKAIAFAAAMAFTVAFTSCSKGLEATYEESQQVPPVDTTNVGEPYSYYVKDEKSKILIVRQGGDRFDYSYNGFGLEARPDTIKRNASEGVKLLTTEKSVNGNDTLRFDLTDTYSEVLTKGILVNYSEKGKSYILTPEMGLKVRADLKVINSQETKFNFYELARVKFELWSDKSIVAQAKLLATDSIFVVTNFAAEMPADTTMVSWSESDKAVSAKVVTVLSGDTTVANYSLEKLHKLYAEELKEIKTDNLNFFSENSLTLSSTEKGNWAADDSGKLQAQVVVEKYNHKNSHRTNKVTRESYHEFVLKVNGKTFTYESKPASVEFVKNNIGEKTSSGNTEVLPVESVYSSTWKGDVVTTSQHLKLIKEVAQNEQTVDVTWSETETEYVATVKISNTVDTQNDKTYTLSLSKDHSVKAEELKRIETNNFSTTYNGLALQSTTPGNWVYDTTGELKAQQFVRTYVHSTSQGNHTITQSYNGNFIVTVNGVEYPINLSEPTISFSQERKGSAQMSGEMVEVPVSLDYSSVYGKSTKNATQEIVLHANAIGFSGEEVLVASRTDAYRGNYDEREGTYDCVLSKAGNSYNFRYRKVGETNWTVVGMSAADGEKLLQEAKKAGQALAVYKENPWLPGYLFVGEDFSYFRYNFCGKTTPQGFPDGHYAIDKSNKTMGGEKRNPIIAHAVKAEGATFLVMEVEGGSVIYF